MTRTTDVFMVKFVVAVCFAIALLHSTAARSIESEDVPAAIEKLSALDLRVLKIAYHLSTENASHCEQTMPALGLLLHSRDQYSRAKPEIVAQMFGNGQNLAVQTILPGGPAANAALPTNAAILQINDWMPPHPSEAGLQIRLQAHNYLAQQAADKGVLLRSAAGGTITETLVTPRVACRSLVEVVISDRRFARTNGAIIQISSALADRLDDQQLAVVIAHELAHSVLGHREKLGDTRDRKAKRAAEEEADKFSLRLLRDAGYDPKIGPAFWRSKIGRKVAGGIFGRGHYPSARKRAKLMEDELTRLESK